VHAIPTTRTISTDLSLAPAPSLGSETNPPKLAKNFDHPGELTTGDVLSGPDQVQSDTRDTPPELPESNVDSPSGLSAQTPPSVTTPAPDPVIHSQPVRRSSRDVRPPKWHSDYDMS
jgi:hypothetical protein